MVVREWEDCIMKLNTRDERVACIKALRNSGRLDKKMCKYLMFRCT